MQRRRTEFAVCRHLDGYRYKVNEVIADHREGIGKPAVGTESFSRFPCALLVAVATAASFRLGRPLITGMCDTLAQPDLAFAPTIPTRIVFLVMVNNSTKLMSGPYSTMTCRAICVSLTKRFTTVNAEQQPELRRVPITQNVGECEL